MDTHIKIEQPLFGLAVKLFVYQEYEQIDVDLGLVEHFHDGHALVLHLQQVLSNLRILLLTHSRLLQIISI